MIVAASVVLMSASKVDIHLIINAIHNPFLDLFFEYWTYVGDGVFVGVAAIIISVLLFRSQSWTPFLYGLALLLLSGASAQLLKRLVFEHALRPSAYITEHTLYLVDGIQIHSHHSLPSGHTTAAFAFFGYAALFLARKKAWLQIVFALCAGLVGYSRMYLSQHFLEDVFAGMILGCFWVILLVFVFRKQLNKASAQFS